jgi:hypothetical protein
MNDIGAAIKDAVDHHLPVDDRIEMVEMKAMTGVARVDQRRGLDFLQKCIVVPNV